jgi:parallel beta-helix repeat protein
MKRHTKTKGTPYIIVFSISLIFLLFASCKKDSAFTKNNSTGSGSKLITAATSSPVLTGIIDGTGRVLREEWDNVAGNDVSEIPVTTTPSSTSTITSLEGPQGHGNNYGDRMRAYITAPVTGSYVFSIAADDAGELWLSTDDNATNKVKIANTVSWTNFEEWSKFTSQTSAAINLMANQKYYIEVLHKQGAGGDNVSVKWQLPDGTTEAPIPASRLTAYVPGAAATATAAATPATSSYIASTPIILTGAHDLTISGKSIIGALAPAITLINCYNIHITNNKLYNSTDVGIHALGCKNITIDYNYFTNVSSGVYIEQTTSGGIVVDNNQFLNMIGPFPRGQFVQFNNVSGPGSSISNNKGENIFGQSYAEDAINLYQSNGTAASPIMITGNWIRGGGPSSSGGGIMLGDNGGSYLTATNNILVNPGEYGMAIAGGNNNTLSNNSVYGKQQYFTNVGIYVNSINGYTVSNCTVENNQVNFFNANNYNNNAWLAPGTNKPVGWDGNTWGANINESILPAVIITSK